MRWAFGIASTLAALMGLAFAAGYYLLPPVSAVTRSAQIDRPASIVYPLLINLRAFNEYSPWFDRDPKADYTFEGPREGAGQIARWSSSVSDLGDGGIRLVKTVENREVDARVVLGAGPIPFAPAPRTLSKLTLTPNARGVSATWTLTNACSPEPIAVPCRLAAFAARWPEAGELQTALAKLKGLAEQLPALDIADFTPERVSLEAQDFAYFESDQPEGAAAFQAALRRAFGAVDAFLKQNRLVAAGPPLALSETAADGRQSVRAGRPFSGPLPVGPAASAEVKIGKTPGGPALKVLYVGPYSDMTPTYAKLDAYVRAHRLSPAGDPWEVYLDDPDKVAPGALRTEIYYPVDDQ